LPKRHLRRFVDIALRPQATLRRVKIRVAGGADGAGGVDGAGGKKEM
tara:strand:+ start:2145 stop:2285 length:141 start_codon:yes stop_codon:yes gene_type:complete